MIKKQKGFTLVELMISVLLGSIFSIMAIKLLETNKQASNLQFSSEEMENSARFSLDMIVNDIRMAGFSQTINDDLVKEPIDFTLSTEGGNENQNDSVTIQYTPIDGIAARNCTGNVVAVGNDVINTYDVVGTDLRCNGIIMMANVMAFQLLYGVDFDNNGSPDRYLEADNAALFNGTGSERIVSVRIFVVKSSESTFDGRPARTFRVLNEPQRTFPANSLYRIYTRTALMPNML